MECFVSAKTEKKHIDKLYLLKQCINKWSTAVPSVRKIKNSNKNRKIMIGASHHFFLSDRKSQNSFKIDNFDKFFLY